MNELEYPHLRSKRIALEQSKKNEHVKSYLLPSMIVIGLYKLMSTVFNCSKLEGKSLPSAFVIEVYSYLFGTYFSERQKKKKKKKGNVIGTSTWQVN